MSYIALYRKWRPLTFSDVVEQQHVVTALKNTVTSRRIAHAYLFCGTRGTGKTTMAKIFARAINCLSPENGDPCNKCEICRGILNESLLDVVEIDAASNNKVENVRDIRDEVAYSPASAEYKVYIIDEVHMMTTSAFNALLKTLEEPPPRVVFILATTDPHKLPATILSRCQRFDFKRISKENIAARIKYIAENSDCKLHDDSAALLARLADGALRDGVSLLDQCISTGGNEITIDVVRAVTGMAGNEHLSSAAEAIETGDLITLINLVSELLFEGKDLQRFSNDLNAYFRDLLVCCVSDNPKTLIDPSLDLESLISLAKRFGLARISDIIRELSLLEYQLKQTTQVRTVFEAALIRMASCLPRPDATVEERLTLLETAVKRSPSVAGHEVATRTATPTATPEPSISVPEKPVSSGNPAVHKKPTKSEDSSHADSPASSAVPSSLIPFPKLTEVITHLNSLGRRMISTYLSDATAYTMEENVIGIVSKMGAGVLHKPELSGTIISSIQAVTGLDVRLRFFENFESISEAVGEYTKTQTDVDMDEQIRKSAEIIGVTIEIK